MKKFSVCFVVVNSNEKWFFLMIGFECGEYPIFNLELLEQLQDNAKNVFTEWNVRPIGVTKIVDEDDNLLWH